MTENIIISMITTLGLVIASFLTNWWQSKKARAENLKTKNELNALKSKLGLEKDGLAAQNANTWMDVAQKAATEYNKVLTEYNLVLAENSELRGKVEQLNSENSKLRAEVDALAKRVKVLEQATRRKKVKT